MVLLTKAESAFDPRGATMTHKPEFLTKLRAAGTLATLVTYDPKWT